MNEKIQNHIDLIFEDAPKTRKRLELKEELLANTEERYQDLLKEGFSPEDAYSNVIDSIGNVSELFQELELESSLYNTQQDVNLRKRSIMKTIAVGLYIFGIVVFFSFSMIEDFFWSFGNIRRIEWSTVGLIMMLLIDIIPTCILVYTSHLYPKYRREEDNMVEEFKEWKSGMKRKKKIEVATYTIVWTMIFILYFIISFATMAWYITWVLFLVGICLSAIVSLILSMKSE